jgi:small-conductance mechanosensitive channel
MSAVGDAISTLQQTFDGDLRYVFALLVLIGGLVLGLFIGRLNRRLLWALGVDEAVEGTSFERALQSFGTSTVSLFARLTAWFIYGLAVLAALHTAGLLRTEVFWLRATGLIPNLIVAAAILAAGIVIGDKVELTISEALKGVKLPEISILPLVAKYTVVFVAVLLAAGQIGISTLALLVLLAAYAFGIILLSGLALQDLLRSASAGVYILLRDPYGIGDQVEIGDHAGVVQEVTVFVTRIEDEGREYVVPNHRALQAGVVVIRE